MDRIGHRRSVIGGLALVALCSAVGAAAPPLLAFAGWRGLWLANAAAVVMCAGAVAWVTRGGPDERAAVGRAPHRDVVLVLRSGGPGVLGLVFAAYAGQFLPVLAFLPTLLVEADGLDPGTTGLLTARRAGTCSAPRSAW